MLECIKLFYSDVIVNRRLNHGLKEFVVQSDNGEFASDSVLAFLKSVGGDRRTCCAYTPEIMAFIERLWGVINSMARAMMLEKNLNECYWEFAQVYALDIYNNIPPTRTPKGQLPKSPNEKFFGTKEDTSLYKVFGCRAFAHIPKQVRRKTMDARAIQCVFIGLNRSSYPGYVLYSPEFNTTYVSGDVVFHPNLGYDGTISKYNTQDTLQKDNLPEDSVERYMYLVGTNHIDPDDGLLYKVTKVEAKNFRGQGTFIVAHRAQVLKDGLVSTKCDRDVYHIKDIENYYNDHQKYVQLKFPHVVSVPSDTKKGEQPDHVPSQVPSSPISRKRPRVSIDSSNYSLPLFYSRHDVQCCHCFSNASRCC